MYRLWSLIVAGCLGFGCAGSNGSSTTKPPEELEVVRLLDEGGSPQEVARYHIEAGTTVDAALDFRTAIGAATPEGSALAVSPGVRLILRAGPVATKDGSAQYELHVADAAAVLPENTPKEMIEEIKAALQALTDLKGSFIVDDRGIIRHAEVPYSASLEELPPRLLLMLSNFRRSIGTIPFPSEPIGLGARWEVRTHLRIFGIRVEQVATYTLVHRENDQLGIELSVQQTGTAQIVQIQPDVQMHLTNYRMHADGQAAVDLKSPLSEAMAQGSSSANFMLVSQNGAQPVVVERQALVRLTHAQ